MTAMSNAPPPARRRPTSGTPSSGSGSRAPVRRSTAGAAAARPAKLVVVAGPMEGEEFALSELEYTVGRSADNPICIQDTSVSRKHVTLRKESSGWMVSDMGSGNGTILNGEPIAEETLLANGDVITLGDSELRYEDTANSTAKVQAPTGSRPRPSTAAGRAPTAVPTRPAREGRARPQTSRAAAAAELTPEAQRKRMRMKLAGVAVLVVLFAGLGVARSRMRQQAEEQGRIEAEQREYRAQLGGLFQEAKNLVREGQWEQAKAKLEELHTRASDYPGVEDYLKAADREIPNQKHLSAAQAALTKGELASAKASIDKVTSDTQQYEQLKTARKNLLDAADTRTKEAKGLLDTRQLDNVQKAKAITDDVLATFPEHRDGKLVNDDAARVIADLTRPDPVRVAAAPKPWEPAVERFRDGDITGAVAILNACAGKTSQCKQVMGQVTEFGNLYKKLEDLDAKGLTRLLALDKDITDGRGSKMGRNAGTRAGTIYYKSAAGAKAAGQWSRAMEFARRALQADPNHTGAANIVNDLKGKAKDLYMQAYSIKDSSPEDALPKFRDVVAMTPPDDELHGKAQGWVEKLSR
ncbi:FHA domain-containing protein [Corallococcus sp. AB004]|nr:FHA domain-containing protein [Corallococcus exiguus]RKI01492.1 FHA domain-containing protein [Corallococcus sp. AB038B]RKI36042.1 FHA domain-containing protein [Corallococcus sp. AB004]